MLTFSDCLDKGKSNRNALRPRGPFLFRSAGKGSKRGRFARHFGSEKIQPRATQQVERYAALAFRQRPAAHKDAGYESDQKPCFFVHSFLLLDLIDKLPPRRKASFRRGEFLLLQRGQPHKLPPGFRKITALSPLFHFILSTPPKTTANFQKTLVKDLTIISLFFEICN